MPPFSYSFNTLVIICQKLNVYYMTGTGHVEVGRHCMAPILVEETVHFQYGKCCDGVESGML